MLPTNVGFIETRVRCVEGELVGALRRDILILESVLSLSLLPRRSKIQYLDIIFTDCSISMHTLTAAWRYFVFRVE